ncbi:MAG TPA: type II secretion system F family protein, partial [Verrucomicrobiae bacterium]|nr:type II secretion system F family protein [Verrucomicrobiae bacterium]
MSFYIPIFALANGAGVVTDAPGFPFAFLRLMIALIIWVGTTGGSIFLIHFLLTVPMRRAERARLFLDLIETALNQGQPIEEMIISVSRSRERAVGVRFHLLAAYIEEGLNFGPALAKVPRFLPPEVSAILQAGVKLGDLRRVLPACREILRDRPAAVRSAIHYMIVVIMFFSPVAITVITITMTFVVPKFKEVASGMGAKLWPVSQFVFANAIWLVALEVVVFVLLFGLVLVYVGGPRFARWFQFRGLPFVDWIAWKIPWKRKRLQRTFSAMLAVLLDGGLPEPEAIQLAGDCTSNAICCGRATQMRMALEQGKKLDDAVRALDDSGEFRWRLTNAIHARGGFLNALRGWHESLDAKAFQQEEAAAHAITSGLVILNGLIVALVATAMYGVLIAV